MHNYTSVDWAPLDPLPLMGFSPTGFGGLCPCPSEALGWGGGAAVLRVPEKHSGTGTVIKGAVG